MPELLELLVQRQNSNIAFLYEKVADQDEVIACLMTKNKTLMAEQVEREELGSDLTSSIATLEKKVVDKDEVIACLEVKNKTLMAEQVEQEELGSNLILSLQATIGNLEAKITALRKAEATARQVVSGYRELMTSTKLVMERKVKHMPRPTSLENRWDVTGIKAMLYQLDLLEARYSPHKSARTTPSSRDLVQAEQVEHEGPGQEELPPGPQPRGGRRHGPEQGDQVHCPPPYPQVDWENLARPTWKDRVGLPTPNYLPLLGCSQDPNHYSSTEERNCLGRTETVPSDFEKKEAPFGQLLGYRTNMGPVRMPTCSIHGHVFDMVGKTWVIAASTPEAYGRRTKRRPWGSRPGR